MSGGEELVADAVQGAIAARAVEPDHGESDGHSHETACLNCGTPLLGSHCHACGQVAHVHKTIGAFFHDLLHGVFHFEGKIWRTLPLLAWNPGRLTREYIDGRRASYVSPIALFLFCVFLMFAVIKQVGGEFDPKQSVEANGQVIGSVAEAEHGLKRLEAQRAELVRLKQPTGKVDGQIADYRSALETMQQVKRGGFSADEVSSDIPWLDRQLKSFKSNPAFVLYKLQNNAYKFSWALIPISVPFVWLLFAWRRRFGLYDHTVFVTYSLCFMTLLVVAVTLGGAVGLPGMAALALLLPPVHMFRQLRGTYALGIGSALWRTLALLVISLTALILFALLLVAES